MDTKKHLDSVWLTILLYTGRKVDRYSLSMEEIEQVLTTTDYYDRVLRVTYDSKEANKLIIERQKELETLCLNIIKRISLEKYEQSVLFSTGEIIILNLQ